MIDPIDVVGDRVRHWTEQNNPNSGPGVFVRSMSNLTVVRTDVVFGPATPGDVRPESLQSAEWVNNTSVQASQTFSVQKASTDTFAYSFKEGLKSAAKAKVEIPFVGEADISLELSFEATQTTTETRSRSWTYSSQIPIAPHRKVVVRFMVNQATYSIPMTARAVVRGTVYIELKKDGSNFRRDIRHLIHDLSWNPATFEVSSVGTFEAVLGQSYLVRADEYELDGTSTAEKVLDLGVPREGGTLSTFESSRLTPG